MAALTADICAKSPVAIRTGKAMFARQRSMSLEEAYDYAGTVMACNAGWPRMPPRASMPSSRSAGPCGRGAEAFL